MAQYLLFLVLAPFALAGTLSALLLPRIVHSYQRYAGLRFFIWVQLFYLVNNVAEFFAGVPSLKHALASFDYVFIGSGPALWLLFSLEYTGMVRRSRPWMSLLFALPVAAGAAALAQGADGVIWRGLEFYPYPWGLAMRSGSYGPLALILFAYDYALLVVGSFILMREAILSHRLYRRQTAWLMAGMLLPLASHFVYTTRLIPGWTKDFSAIAGAFGGFCFSVGTLRYRLFTIRPVSRQTVLQHMRVGMMVIDPEGSIIDLNHAACVMIGKSELQLLGLPAEPVLAALGEKRYEISKHPLSDADGRLEAWHVELRGPGAEAPAEPPEAPADSPILSLGELRVVELLERNLANKEIAVKLGVSVSTVKFHLKNVYRKTGTRNRAELVHRIHEVPRTGAES